MSSKFITEVKQYADTEDYYIEIPDHILNTLKWKEGDEICWSVKDGKIILTKVKDASSTEEEPGETNDWYSVKGEAIDQYLEDTAKETFGQYYHSPEAQGNWQTPMWP